jgi:hypothetical protein
MASQSSIIIAVGPFTGQHAAGHLGELLPDVRLDQPPEVL